MIRYLLDTNAVSDLVNNPGGKLQSKIAAVGEHRVCTSIIVAAELRYGVEKRQSKVLAAQVEAVLSRLEVLPFAAPADRTYGMLRARLRSPGQPIGGTDLFVAAHALAIGCAIVSDNVREFGRIEGLQCENWLRE